MRERKEDIPLLADYFLEKLYPKTGKKINGFSQNVVKMMIANPWLGNIRELENMVERSMLTTKGDIIREMDFPKVINYQNTDQDVQVKTLQEFEKEYILKIIKNVTAAFLAKQALQNYWDCLRQRLFPKCRNSE